MVVVVDEEVQLLYQYHVVPKDLVMDQYFQYVMLLYFLY
jgi:hypothetical protein